MFDKLKHLFDRHIALKENDSDMQEKLRVACAALFLEMMHTEEKAESEKLNLILGLLETTFGLTEHQASALMEIAEHRREQATDYFEFTHFICIEYTHEQKLQLIESLWQVAFTDNHLGIEEEYLVDKVARLLFVPHADVLAAKNRVRYGQ